MVYRPFCVSQSNIIPIYGLPTILCKPIQQNSNLCSWKSIQVKIKLLIHLKFMVLLLWGKQKWNYLVITIDQKRKFAKHVDNLCKNAVMQINIMCRFKGIFDLKEREIIYNTFISAHFNYCPMACHFLWKGFH